MLSAGLLKNLPKENIFVLIEDLKEASNEFSKIKIYTSNEIIFREGDLMDGLYLPIDQPLDFYRSGELFGSLQKGRTLSISSLIDNEPLSYEVRATKDVKVLFLAREIFIDVLKQNPEVGTYLQYVSKYSSIRSFKNFLSNHDISNNELIHIIASIKPASSINETLLKSNIALIESGEVTVNNKEGSSVLINITLSSGVFFGGAYYTPPHTAPYTFVSKEFKGFVLPHEFIKFNIKDQQILDKIISEPWLNIKRINNLDRIKKFQTISEFSFRKLTPREIAKNGYELDLVQLRHANNDFDGNICTIYNTLSFMDREANYEKIKQKIYQLQDNLSAYKIIELLHEHYLECEAATEPDDSNLNLPYITFLKNRSILVFGKKGNKRICIDPIHGVIEINFKEIQNNSSGEFITIRKNDFLRSLFTNNYEKADTKEKNKLIKNLLSDIIWANKSLIQKILILSLASFAFGALVPFLSQILLDEVLKTNDLTTLTTISVGMLLCYLYIVLFTYIKNKQLTNLGMNIDKEFTTLTYRSACGLDQQTLNQIEVGGVINRLSEIGKVRDFFSSESVNSLVNMVTGSLFIVILAVYSWEVALLPVVYGITIYFIRKYLKQKLIRVSKLLFDIKSEAESFIATSITSVKTIKTFGSEVTTATSWDNKLTKEVEKEKEFNLHNSVLTSVNTSLAGILQISGIWLVVYLSFAKPDGFSAGSMFAISQYLQKLITPINNFIDFLVNWDEMEVSLEKISELVFGKKDPNLLRLRKNAIDLHGKVKIDRVSFKYEGSPKYILQDINLTIFPRQIIAFVGKSGSGKTTLANIVSSDILPTSGKIFYDDMDSDALSYHDLKNQIGFIQQSNDLFAGRVKDNIAFDDDIPDANQIEKSAIFSNSDEFLNKLPQKYDTYLAEGGMGLSGGQKQRVSISKVVYKTPKIIIFDEATSALDSQTEKIVLQNIKKSAETATVILIAHRLSTIRSADYIYVLDNGRIVEQGTHKELIRNNSHYTELFREQLA